MVFYTAGPMADRPFVKEVAEKLRDAYYDVNSRWLDVPEETPEGMTQDEYMHQQAVHDLEDLLAADALIYVNTGHKSEGKATELGVAMATAKPIVVVGGKENNIFLHLGFPNFPTIEEAIQWIKTEEEAYNQQRNASGSL